MFQECKLWSSSMGCQQPPSLAITPTSTGVVTQDSEFWLFQKTWLESFCHYSMVDPSKYRKATSYIQSVKLLGYSVGSVLGQLLFSLELLSYNDALIFTLILIAIALLVSFFLPMPQRSMFFHRKRKLTGDFQGEERSGEPEEAEVKTEDHQELAEAQTCGKVLLQMIRDFRECFASKQLLYWSLWWVMATCGFNQTINFIQVSYRIKF